MSIINYDKLFENGNVVGYINKTTNTLYTRTIDNNLESNIAFFEKYKNEELTNKNCIVRSEKTGEEYSTDFVILFILKLNLKGEIVETVYSRFKNCIKENIKTFPTLGTGMFGEVKYYNNQTGEFTEKSQYGIDFGKFVIVEDKIIYQNGGFDSLPELINLTKENDSEFSGPRITTIYDECSSFSDCAESKILWSLI